MAAGVSLATASRALTGVDASRPGTVDRMTQVADRMGDQANEIGPALREGSIRAVLVVPVVSNPFRSQIVQFTEAELEANGFEILVADSHGEVDREARRIRMLVAREIEGLIVIPSDA